MLEDVYTDPFENVKDDIESVDNSNSYWLDEQFRMQALESDKEQLQEELNFLKRQKQKKYNFSFKDFLLGFLLSSFLLLGTALSYVMFCPHYKSGDVEQPFDVIQLDNIQKGVTILDNKLNAIAGFLAQMVAPKPPHREFIPEEPAPLP